MLRLTVSDIPDTIWDNYRKEINRTVELTAVNRYSDYLHIFGFKPYQRFTENEKSHWKVFEITPEDYAIFCLRFS